MSQVAPKRPRTTRANTAATSSSTVSTASSSSATATSKAPVRSTLTSAAARLQSSMNITVKTNELQVPGHVMTRSQARRLSAENTGVKTSVPQTIPAPKTTRIARGAQPTAALPPIKPSAAKQGEKITIAKKNPGPDTKSKPVAESGTLKAKPAMPANSTGGPKLTKSPGKSVGGGPPKRGDSDSIEIVYEKTVAGTGVTGVTSKSTGSGRVFAPSQMSPKSSSSSSLLKLKTQPVNTNGTGGKGPAGSGSALKHLKSQPLNPNAIFAKSDANTFTAAKILNDAAQPNSIHVIDGGTPANHAEDTFVRKSIRQPGKRMSQRFEIMLTDAKCLCSSCSKFLDIGDGIVLQDCFHAFCRSCLVATITSSPLTEVKCPWHDECKGIIFNSEIRALLTPEQYAAQVKKSDDLIFAAIPNMFNCKTPNCKGFCEFDEGSKIFLCPLCNKSNCLPCKAIHDGVECTEYQRVLRQAINDGKTEEEAHEFAKAHTTNGFDQLVGTVSAWMSASSINGVPDRRSQQYMQVLEKMANQDLWISNKEFECSICMENVPVGGGVIFECMHSFCRDCSIGVVEHATDPEIKCPYQDGNYSCVYTLKPREIRALVSPELYEVHLARSVKLAENAMANTFHCKTPDCAGWCEFEPGTQTFHCWICQKRNCLLCEVIHDGTCEDYKNRLVQNVNDVKSNEAVEAMINTGECMRCPNCKVPVQKIAGCDWVPCAVCRTEICWITKGPRWGPGGKGDITGGCRCRVDGKLCHPKCGNCH